MYVYVYYTIILFKIYLFTCKTLNVKICMGLRQSENVFGYKVDGLNE